jgi:hypothetical protein
MCSGMNLVVSTLMLEIHELAKRKGFDKSRVLAKVNARSELVIGLIIPPRTPDEWSNPPRSADVREAKRAARERRS